MTMKTGHKIYCGGAFCFDYREDGYEAKAERDYRAGLLGSVETLLKPKDGYDLKICEDLTYVGPFYFVTESMKDEEIISYEKRMIESCTDAIFVLDDATCPGTIAEMMYANSLKKDLYIYYVSHDENVETESALHTPCWYPILFCRLTNSKVRLYPCVDYEDAKHKVMENITSIRQ